MGKIVKKNQPCPNPECNSSDALQVYENNSSHCFSCGKTFWEHEISTNEPAKAHTGLTVQDIEGYSIRGNQARKIKKVVAEFFGVRAETNSDNVITSYFYPYPTGYKQRRLPKIFTWVGGQAGGLFGKDKFASGGKRLVITEGEDDALAVAQASLDRYEKIYPVISLRSATTTDDLIEAREWIRSFDEVVLCLDNDKAGEEAKQKSIRIIGIDKIKVWNPGKLKDACDVLLEQGSEGLMRLIWDAERWSPAGIISKEDIWKQISERNKIASVPYPPCMAGVNKKIKGKRKGEIVLLISGTGSGKSTLIRENILYDLETTEDRVGVISLEESPGETGLKLSGMAIRRNPANEEIPEDELKVGFDAVFGTDRVVVLDHQGSIKDDSILDQLEYMCLIGCKSLYIDHITILVSEGADGLTGNEAIDKIMNDLLRLVKRHDVCVVLVSHLRKVQTGSKSFEEGKLPTMDDIRGSGSIKQVSFDIIGFARDMGALDAAERNTIKMAVLKSRTMGQTGPVQGAVYDNETGRLAPASEEAFEVL